MKKNKILIVEDETIVALEMKRSLEKIGFEVTNAIGNYDDALNSVKANKPDIILMDINLGNSKDGIETTEEIHTIDKIPVIYITAYSDEKTIERAAKTDPVSYLIKPFKREELKSNILLGLYKKSQAEKDYKNNEMLNIGLDYYYDIRNRKLYFKEIHIKLSTKEDLLLKLLIESRGNIVPFEELEHQLWINSNISDSTLRTLVYRLRSKLEHKLIETIPSVGCRLIDTNHNR